MSDPNPTPTPESERIIAAAVARAITHITEGCYLDGDPRNLTECQADSFIVGGPHEHDSIVGIEHLEMVDGRCYDAGICKAHLPFSVAFILNERWGELFDAHDSLRAIRWTPPPTANSSSGFDWARKPIAQETINLWERAY